MALDFLPREEGSPPLAGKLSQRQSKGSRSDHHVLVLSLRLHQGTIRACETVWIGSSLKRCIAVLTVMTSSPFVEHLCDVCEHERDGNIRGTTTEATAAMVTKLRRSTDNQECMDLCTVGGFLD